MLKFNKGELNSHSIYAKDLNNLSNKTNTEIYQNIFAGIDTTPMFEYLLNFSHQRLSDLKSINYFNYSGISVDKNEKRYLEEIEGDNTYYLPKISKVKYNITNVIEKRESIREYAGSILSLKTLSTILHYSMGINKKHEINFGEKTINTRYYSSGGGLYPVSFILYLSNIESIKDGFYRYQPFSHSLLFLNNSGIKGVFDNNVVDVINSNCIFFFNAELNRSYIKYGELSLINILIEIGIVSQNIHLMSNSFNLGTCDIAGFNKNLIEKKLNIDGVHSHILYSLSMGVK